MQLSEEENFIKTQRLVVRLEKRMIKVHIFFFEGDGHI